MTKLISSKNKIKPKTDILSGEYRGCDEVEVTIPDGTTRIRSYAFENCPNLTTVICPKSLMRIDENAFYNCPNLKEVLLDNSDKIITSRITASLEVIKSGSSYILGDSVRKGYSVEIEPKR